MTIGTKDIEYLAKIMDSKFKGPFGLSVGLDGLIGLIPGVGDLLTTLVSFYIVIRASLERLPVIIVLRMCLNILIENLVGIIPIVGNLFDFVWKSNNKNLELLKNYQAKPESSTRSSKFVISIAVFVSLCFTAALLSASVYVIKLFIDLLVSLF